MRTSIVALTAVVSLAASGGAQIIRQPERPKQRAAWTSVSLGLMQLSDVRDGTTGSEWHFGNAVQYRVTLEMPMQFGTTIGIMGGFARVPMTYATLTGFGVAGCGAQCDADATVTQLAATLHAGGGAIGFHQVIDLSVGATGYSSFRARTSGDKLPPTKLDADLTLGLGYGFGYALSPDMQIDLVQEGFLTVHQREGLAGGENALGRVYITRVGVRFGF